MAGMIDVGNWYRSTLGRDPDQAGLDYWTKQVGANSDPSQTYQNFVASAQSNGEKVGVGMSPNPAPAPAAAPSGMIGTVAPTKWDVTKDQTVQGQLEKIIDPNNPLQTQAQTYANQQANSRGLLNSSLAVSAAQDALYKNAVPIAQQDANVNASAGQFNANSANTASTANVDNQVRMATANLNANTHLAIANLDIGSKSKLAELDAQNRQLLQTNSSASSLYNSTMQNIANISASTNMDAAGKQQATDNQLKLLQQSLSAMSATAATSPQAIANLNLAQFFQQAQQEPVAPVAATAPTPAPAAAQNPPGLINTSGENRYGGT